LFELYEVQLLQLLVDELKQLAHPSAHDWQVKPVICPYCPVGQVTVHVFPFKKYPTPPIEVQEVQLVGVSEQVAQNVLHGWHFLEVAE
jgi:hypothetical protein